VFAVPSGQVGAFAGSPCVKTIIMRGRVHDTDVLLRTTRAVQGCTSRFPPRTARPAKKPWRIKGEDDMLPVTMNLRQCRVTVSDMEGVKHSLEVTASTLYEAVALGLVAIREQDWAGEIAEGLNTVDVSVTAVPVMHSVRMQDFNKWLSRKGGTPNDLSQRKHIRQILGLGGSDASG